MQKSITNSETGSELLINFDQIKMVKLGLGGLEIYRPDGVVMTVDLDEKEAREIANAIQSPGKRFLRIRSPYEIKLTPDV